MAAMAESAGLLAENSANRSEGSLTLTLDIVDPEVVAELEKQPAGLARERYALGALRLGVIALRQASGELDSSTIRQAGQEILSKLGELLTSGGTSITTEITGALRQYFDPSTGTLPQRIESLIKNDGDLERTLKTHLAPENSTIARAIAAHFGEGSPIFKLLSPDDAQGLKGRIETMLGEVFEDQQEQILKEFSLDKEDSALSRLIRKVAESNGDLKTDVKSQVDALVDEFSLDKPDSALSRLVKKVEDAQGLIGQSLTLDDENSPLSRLKRELKSTIDGLVSENSAFQAEVRAALASLQAKKETAAKSTLHGHAFEEQLGNLLDIEARRLNDVFESTGSETGAISHCKVGDYVTTLGPDSAAPGARIVWEAKSNKSYDLVSALKEIDQARKNRQAQVGVFVFSKSAAPDGLEPLARYGNDIVVVWDSEDPSTDLHVTTALSLARALVIRETHESAESEQALDAIELAVRAIEKQLKYLDEFKTQAETIRGHGDKIVNRAAKVKEELADQVSELDKQVAALKTSKAQA